MSDRRLRNTKWGRTGSYQSYDDVKAFFDVWANKPDKDIEGSISYEADLTDCYYGPAMISELLLSELKNGPKRILDIGCGTGLAGSPLIQAGHTLYGLDLSHQMLDLALNKGYTEVFVGNFLSDDLPWQESFDAMICVGVVGEWVPAIPLLGRTIKHLSDESDIAITLEIEHSDIGLVVNYLESKEFRVTHLSKKLGLNHPVYEEEYYFYLVANRGT